MKIRIKGNSIRIRLSRPEVDSFCNDGYLEEKTDFGNTAFIYALRALDGLPALSADCSENKITMYVPAEVQKDWATNETVGFENHMALGNDTYLYLLLEKDFKCLDAPPHEDQSDNFENPHKVC